MVQDDVAFMGKMVESLVVEFAQAKYEEFLSSGSKSLRVAQKYHRISLEIHSQVPSETSPKIACINSAISGCVACVGCVKVSHETREANVIGGQSGRTLPLSQLQITGT